MRKSGVTADSRFCRREFIVAALAAGAAGCAHAGSARGEGGDGEIAALLAARIDVQRRGTGGIIGVVRRDHVSFVAHGVVGVGGAQRVDADSVFQVASLTKIFTALLFADAATRGEVGWEDPLARHLPVDIPQFGAPITLLDLATHSSGLPLRPGSRLDRGQDDPYDGYSAADLLTDIAAARLARAPGEAFEYSNFGYALLGAALAHRLGRSYAELLQERILAPLGLDATRLGSPADSRRVVQGYDRNFQPMRPWDFGALAPAGGLFSTSRDITRFLKVWTKGEGGGLAEAARAMLTPRRAGDDAETEMAVGWRMTRLEGRDIAWSNGSGGGMRSFMGLAPDTATGAAAFVNMATGAGVDDIGMRVLAPAYEVDVAPVPERAAIDVPADILDRYVGAYSAGPGREIAIERDGAGLILVLGRSVRIPLIAETVTIFYMREENVALEFRPPGGVADEVVLRQGDETLTYRRLPG